MLKIFTITFAVFASLLGIALTWGGPRSIEAMPSINQPFIGVDNSTQPQASHFTARDGTALAWMSYAGMGAAGYKPQRRIVLVHGSSAGAKSMHTLARALAEAGFQVAALDIRGHGDSGPRGTIGYIGQLEDDLQDFMRAAPFEGPSTLLGFSSGAGFVLRMAGSDRQALFDRYVLLSPFLGHDAPTAQAGPSTWASVGMARIVALTALNALGITHWNDLPVLRFALDDYGRQHLTPFYSYAMMANFGVYRDYAGAVRRSKGDLRVLAGRNDELIQASLLAGTFAKAGRSVPVTVINGVTHIGMILEPPAVAAVVQACRD